MRVFISYRIEDDNFAARALAVADKLRSAGVDAWIDRYVTRPPSDWALLLTREFLRADIIIVICSDGYRKVFEDGVQSGGMGRGVAWEAALLRSELWRDGGRARRCLPLLLPGQRRECIPRILDLANLFELKEEPGRCTAWRRLLETCEATGESLQALTPALSSAVPMPNLAPLPATQVLAAAAFPTPDHLRRFLTEKLPDVEEPTAAHVDHIDRVFALVRTLAHDDLCRLFDALEVYFGENRQVFEAIDAARAAWGWAALPVSERRWGALVGAFPGGLPDDVVPRNLIDVRGRWGQFRLVDGIWSVDAASTPPPPEPEDLAAALTSLRRVRGPSLIHREVEILALLLLDRASDAWHAWDRMHAKGWPGSVTRMYRLARAFFQTGDPERPHHNLEPAAVQKLLGVLHVSCLHLGDVGEAGAAIRALWGRRTHDEGRAAELWARMCMVLGDFSAAQRHLNDAEREAPEAKRRWLQGLRGRLQWLSTGAASVKDFMAVEAMPVRQQVLLDLWGHEVLVTRGGKPPDLTGTCEKASSVHPADLSALCLLEGARLAVRQGDLDRADSQLRRGAAIAEALGFVPLGLDVELGRCGVARRRGIDAAHDLPEWIECHLPRFPMHERIIRAKAAIPLGW